MKSLAFVGPVSGASVRALAVAAASAGGLALAACGGNEYEPPPPPPVTVAEPLVKDVVRYAEFTGTTTAVESVEVRARVEGFLDSMHFQPGEPVEKGQLLFVIDPEPFEVALESAQAELDSNKAERDLKETEYERTRTMYKSGATSELDLIRARAQRDRSRAAVSYSEAAVHSAKLDLDYAHVKAPVSGRIGRHLVDIGNLVGAGEATHLTDIVRYDPLYVYFYVSEGDILALQRRSKEERDRTDAVYDDRDRGTIEVRTADEKGYPHSGDIDYAALQIDSDTGTFEVRGILHNKGDFDEVIIPGTFVEVRAPVEEEQNALLISERAIGSDQSGRFLLLIDSKNVVEQRSVELGPLIGEMRVISKGLSKNDRVIVNGLQRARPGAKVTPTQTQPGGAPAPAKAAKTPATPTTPASKGGSGGDKTAPAKKAS